METIHEIPGKVKVEWDPSTLAVIDHWSAMALVSLAEFRTAILERGLNYAVAHHGKAWIADNSAAKGAFNQDIQGLIGSEVFPAFAKAGIKSFITVASADSPLANLSAKKYQAKLGPNGIQLIEVPTLAEGLRWLREHAR